MINAQMRDYTYSKYKNTLDGYGQEELTENSGTIKMTINILNQSVEDSVLYAGANYIGLTMDKAVNDQYIIHYENEKLKVLYVNPLSRYIQVFLARM